MGPFNGVSDFTITMYPATWVLWPLYRGDQWTDDKAITLGPIVIRWRIRHKDPTP